MWLINQILAALNSNRGLTQARLYLLPLVLAPFLLLSPVWATGKALFWGVVSLQFVPWRVLAWEILRSGDLPLWNPLNGMGAPLLANYQTAFLYPPNWTIFLLQALGGVGWAAWGLAILAALHLAWAGLGMARLARQWGMTPPGQAVSGLAFGLSGYLVARLGFLSINAAVAWLPWVILFVDQIDGSLPRQVAEDRRQLSWLRLLRDEIWQLRWLAVCLTFQLLAGHAQTVWFTLLLAILWAAVRGWTRSGQSHPGGERPPMSSRLRSLLSSMVRLGFALGLAIGLAAVQLFPTAEYLLASQRAAQVDYDFAMTYSFWPWRLLTLVAPDMFGNPVRGDYWGYGNYWEDAVYVGVLPLILGLAALVRRQRGSASLFLLVLLSFVLALGKNTPVFPWLYQHVPMFSMFQAPTRISILAVFGLALLAGLGVDQWRRPEGRGLYWTRLATAGGFAVTIGAGLAWYYLKDVNITYLRATALAGIWGLGTGVMSLLAPEAKAGDGGGISARTKGFWYYAVILFVAADLLLAGWGLNPGISQSFYRNDPMLHQPVNQSLGEGRLYIPAEVEETLKFNKFMRFDTFSPDLEWQQLRATVLPNLNLLDGIPSVNNFDPLVPGDYERWMGALEDTSGPVREIVLNLMAVSVVEDMDSLAGYEEIYNQRSAGARLRVVSCKVPAQDFYHAMQIIFSGRIDPNLQVVLDGPAATALAEQACMPEELASDIRITSETANQLTVEVTSDQNAWLVFADTYYPGWQARIDGAPTPIYRANGLFRAVSVHAGTQTVEFLYRPISFYAGALTSLLLLIAFGVAWWRG